ncbi:nucleoplasmin-like protein ANO39 [Nilaparvata lugens]|uniref:nucleoplasmin-like protein ANO39 n=1 Tax=Nilaparvata lugens TaxID=108931 RepID=UPI00193CEBBB|nr:nucleoplasmin-like protein ANO39 [Nilaparvata lugens]
MNPIKSEPRDMDEDVAAIKEEIDIDYTMSWLCKQEVDEQVSSNPGSPLTVKEEQTHLNGEGDDQENERTVSKEPTLPTAYVRLVRLEELDSNARRQYQNQSSDQEFVSPSAGSCGDSSEGEKDEIEKEEEEEEEEEEGIENSESQDENNEIVETNTTQNQDVIDQEYRNPPLKTTVTKRHQCTVCTKRFSQTGSLNVHLRTHAKEKPYQ